MNQNRVISVFLCLLVLTCFVSADLEQSFRNPPDSAKPHTWWHWMNGNVSKEGITADLEAMARVGIGGFQAFHVLDHIPAGPVGYMSDEWRKLMKHSIEEADRLGLEVCLHNCAGWSSSGGPWVTPEYAMQEVVSSETRVQGPKEFEGKLEQPPTKLDYYKDIAVLAFRAPKEDIRIQNWNLKSGYGRSNDLVPDNRKINKENIIVKDDIVNLTRKMDDNGQLKWKVPEGNWIIIRFGYTPTGRVNKPAPPEGEGLECDKMSTEAAEFYWKHSMEKVIDDVGSLAGKVFNNVLIDSYEVGHQNWTHRFAKEFKKRRGYDITPYLPCLTGRIVDSMEISERFLWDFRRTIADLFGDYYFGHFQKMCNRNDMSLSIEPYGRSGNFDDFTVAQYADIPMGEWWARREARWHHWSSKLASSAAHAYGRRFVGAEAFTAGGQGAAWVNHPYLLKSQGDYFHCKGVNRLIFHDYAHHPRLDVKPGMTMGPHGFQCNRGNTWWEQGKAWMEYLARCQYMIQEGTQVADIFYFPGEHSPNTLKVEEELNPQIPYGYDYDACSADIVMKMKVKDGRLVLPSGMSYKILVLASTQSIRPELLKKIRSLAKDGATVVGTKPVKSPSLQDYPKCDKAVQKLAEDINWDKSLEEALADLELKPDFDFVGAKDISDTEYTGNGMEYIHRKIGDADVYFVSNQHHYRKVVDCIFRVKGKVPELWNPDTGKTEFAPVYSGTDDGRTKVQLNLDPAGAVFVVFRETAPDDSIVRITRDGKELGEKIKASGKLEITKALYGVLEPNPQRGKHARVTRQLQGMVRNNSLSVVADNKIAGDPAQGEVKALMVEYVLDGKTFQRKLSEGQSLEINSVSDLGVKQAPADLVTSNGKTMLRAWEPGEYKIETKSGKSISVNIEDVPAPKEIVGRWNLSFPENWGAPSAATFGKLISWSEHNDEGIRHFSGTATYSREFNIAAKLVNKDTALYLDLGNVQVIAEVKLNGKDLGILWKPPFTIDISGAVKKGRNQLEVKVTNLWPNRLIGDEQYKDNEQWKANVKKGHPRGSGLTVLPDWYIQGKPRPASKRYTWATWKFYAADSPLLPSGLIGPVEIRSAVLKDIE